MNLKFYSLLLKRQHLHPLTRGESIKDVKQIVSDIGWIRQTWSLELRIKQWFSRNTSFWSVKDLNYLLKRGDIIQIHNGQRSLFISPNDFSYYMSIYRYPPPKNEYIDLILNTLERKGPMTNTELLNETKIDKQTYRWALDTLKISNNIIMKYKQSLISLPEQIPFWKEVETEAAYNRIISKFIYSYPLITIKKLHELTNINKKILTHRIAQLLEHGNIIEQKVEDTLCYFDSNLENFDNNEIMDNALEELYLIPQWDPLWHFYKENLKKIFNISWGDMILYKHKLIASIYYFLKKEKREIIVNLQFVDKLDSNLRNKIIEIAQTWVEKHTYYDNIVFRVPTKKIIDQNIETIVRLLINRGYTQSDKGMIKRI